MHAALRGSLAHCSRFSVLCCVYRVLVGKRCTVEKEMRVAYVAYLACSAAKPSCASTVVGTPGKSDELSNSGVILRSVMSAKLTR